MSALARWFAVATLLCACSQNGTSGEARECDQAETLKLAILAHAADAGVAGPCSPKEGGVVMNSHAQIWHGRC